MTTRYAWFLICSECGEPIQQLDMIQYIGYNYGTDGHLVKTREEAYSDMALFHLALLKEAAECDKQIDYTRGGFWGSERPFNNVKQEITYLLKNTRLIELQF